jgi:hypothetical protein
MWLRHGEHLFWQLIGFLPERVNSNRVMAGKRRIAAEGLGSAGSGTSIKVFSAGDRLERGGGPWSRQPAPADQRSSTLNRHNGKA